MSSSSSSSFSSSATGPNRMRSLRQPTAGVGSLPKKRDEVKKPVPSNTNHEVPNMSPTRLPKPGASMIPARPAGESSVSGSTAATKTSAIGTRSRPNSSMFGLNRSNSTAARQASIQVPAGKGQGAEPVKGTQTVPTTRSRLTRPNSMVGPSKPLPTSPSRPSSAGSVASASTTATTVTAASKRPPGRAVTTTTRASQPCQVPASPTANTSVSSATSSATSARPSKQRAAGGPPRLRPAFITLQQHYSPARNLAPKPTTASYLAPPTPSKLPANVALSTETSKLQTELLQLHLLHRDADAVTASWHSSARDRLGRRFEELARADQEVGEEEAVVAEAQNLAALKTWVGSEGGRGLEDRIQVLDGVLSGLWILSEPGGQYDRVVREFEKWLDQMTAAVDARRMAGGLGALMESGEVAFIRELDPAWKDEVSSFDRKLEGWRRHLGQLEEGLGDEEQPRSSLVRILTACQSQVYNMQAELDMMERIEWDALSQEAAWIRRMNREDAADDTPGAGAIWRAL